MLDEIEILGISSRRTGSKGLEIRHREANARRRPDRGDRLARALDRVGDALLADPIHQPAEVLGGLCGGHMRPTPARVPCSAHITYLTDNGDDTSTTRRVAC